MTTTMSSIEEILEHSDYSEVAYRRIGFGMETWDITGPDEDATVHPPLANTAEIGRAHV